MNLEEIRKILENCEEEIQDIDGSDTEEGEEEYVEVNYYDSASEQSASDNKFEDKDTESDEEYQFFVGKDQETLWRSEPVAFPGKTKYKNLIKFLSGSQNKVPKTRQKKLIRF